jgi:hypothetical protein
LRRGPRAGPLALALLLALSAGCDRARVHAPAVEWAERWSHVANAGPRWRTGAELLVVTREGRPAGVRTVRERWVLLRRDSLAGQFEVRRDGRAATVVGLPFHAPGPHLMLGYGGVARHGRYAYATGFEKVTVPAGRFRCGRTWRTFEEDDGRMMRVDEWWAPGIPVPVQSWTRWEGVVDTLYAPPRRVADVHVGTEWAVLERIRQP